MLLQWSVWVKDNIGLSVEFQQNVLAIFAAFILIYTLRLIVLKIVFRYKKGVREQYKWRKASLYVASVVFIIIAASLLFEVFHNLLTLLSFVAGALVLALKTPIQGITGWMFIMIKRPFEVGDRIQIGEIAGDVIDQRLFMFSVMEIGNWVDADQSTGRVIHVPNGNVFQYPLINYSQGFEYIWNEIGVLVTFESDWKKAKKILTRIAENHHNENMSQSAEKKLKRAAKKYMIFYSKLTPIVYTSVKDSGVMLTIRHLCNPRERRTMTHNLWEEILTEFEKEKNINLAYPTQRFYLEQNSCNQV